MSTCTESGGEPCAKRRYPACPLLDDTTGRMSDSGEYFEWPDGTVTALYWLPCVSWGEVPGSDTCGDCVPLQAPALDLE